MPSKTFCDPNDFDTFLSSTNGGAMDGVPDCEVDGDTDGDTDGDMDGVISQDPIYIIQNKSDYFVYSLSILSSSVFFEGILPEPRSYVILLSISGYFIAPKLGNQVEIYLSG